MSFKIIQNAMNLSILFFSTLEVQHQLAIDVARQQRRRLTPYLHSLSPYRVTAQEKLWLKAKSTGWYDFVVPQMSEKDFHSNFRMSRVALNLFVTILEPLMKKQDTTIRQAIDVKKRCSIGIYCLTTCAEIRTIASLFGVGHTTALECFDDFVHAVNNLLAPNVIKWPSTEAELATNAAKFEPILHFRMTIAAIDCCHFPVSPPEGRTTDYYNYKGWYSTIAFAACDAEGKVLYVKVGTPCRANDSTIFRNSELHAHITSGNCFPPSNRVIQGVRIPYHLLGDSAFRLMSWCLKPFAHSENKTHDQRRFNYRHSHARRIVENLFGRLKGRFRRVLKRLEVSIENTAEIIYAAFALHSFCEENNIFYDQQWTAEVDEFIRCNNMIQPEDIEIDYVINPTANEVRNGWLQNLPYTK